MASSVIRELQQFWPLTLFKADDLKDSRRIVRRLSLPEQTKQFIFAIPDRKNGSVLYILSVLNLSEQSVSDVEHVIKAIQPDAVIAQIPSSALPEVQAEEDLIDNHAVLLPTSPFGVLSRCFKYKIDKKQYENLTGSLILKEIFGTGFYGHLLSSRKTAEEVDAHFFLLESPHQSPCTATSNRESGIEGQRVSSLLEGKHLLSRNVISVASPGFKRYWLSSPAENQMVNSVTQFLSLSLSKEEHGLQSTIKDCESICNFQAPPFARTIYPLMSDLHDIFIDLPAIGRALIYAQKMLTDVNEGEPVDAQLLLEVQNFRLAVEGLRIALNSASRCPLDKLTNKDPLDFNVLPPEEKCNALTTQALKDQMRKFKSVVAIVDAGSISTIRRHWNTSIPLEFAKLADQCFISFNSGRDGEDRRLFEDMDRKRLLADTPVVAVGAGATAILGASSLTKAMPASTLFKLVAYKIPAIIKFSFAHLQRSGAVGLSKILGSSKILAPGMASKVSGFKASSSAEKIRRMTHSVIASAERTSVFAMRTAFYEIMRKRHVRPFRFSPWAKFGCSMATCGMLVYYGDGIECAAESLPSAPIIASWGRGLQSLQQVSEEVRQANKIRKQEALQNLMYRLKKRRIQ